MSNKNYELNYDLSKFDWVGLNEVGYLAFGDEHKTDDGDKPERIQYEIGSKRLNELPTFITVFLRNDLRNDFNADAVPLFRIRNFESKIISKINSKNKVSGFFIDFELFNQNVTYGRFNSKKLKVSSLTGNELLSDLYDELLSSKKNLIIIKDKNGEHFPNGTPDKIIEKMNLNNGTLPD
jgi:hypothetical protein